MIARISARDKSALMRAAKSPDIRLFASAFFGNVSQVYCDAFLGGQGETAVLRVFGAWYVDAPERGYEEAGEFIRRMAAAEAVVPQGMTAEGYGATAFPVLKYAGGGEKQDEFKPTKAADVGEFERVHGLLCATETFVLPEFEEYYVSRRNAEKYAGGATYYIERDGAVACTCSVMCASEQGAMLGAVATAREHRGRGLAGAIVSAVAGTVGGAHIACYNEAALRVYSRVGFKRIAWRSLLRKR